MGVPRATPVVAGLKRSPPRQSCPSAVILWRILQREPRQGGLTIDSGRGGTDKVVRGSILGCLEPALRTAGTPPILTCELGHEGG